MVELEEILRKIPPRPTEILFHIDYHLNTKLMARLIIKGPLAREIFATTGRTVVVVPLESGSTAIIREDVIKDRGRKEFVRYDEEEPRLEILLTLDDISVEASPGWYIGKLVDEVTNKGKTVGYIFSIDKE